MDANDILRAVLQGAQKQQGGTPPRVPGLEQPDQGQAAAPQGGADAMGGILGAILGGAQQQAPAPGSRAGAPPQGGGDPLTDILGAILGGAQAPASSGGMPGNAPQAGNDPLGSILGAILGGGQAQQPPATGTPQAGDVLGRISGRGQAMPPGGDPTGGILGAILGGGGINPAGNSLLEPIANTLAQKFGIPPQLALVIVSFAVTKLVAAQAGGGTHGQFDANSLMAQLNGSKGVSRQFAHDSGMAQELAEGAGIDKTMAARLLSETYNQLGARTASSGSGGRS